MPERISLRAARAAVPDASDSIEAGPYPGQVRRNLAFENFLDSQGKSGLQARRLISTRTRELVGREQLYQLAFHRTEMQEGAEHDVNGPIGGARFVLAGRAGSANLTLERPQTRTHIMQVKLARLPLQVVSKQLKCAQK